MHLPDRTLDLAMPDRDESAVILPPSLVIPPPSLVNDPPSLVNTPPSLVNDMPSLVISLVGTKTLKDVELTDERDGPAKQDHGYVSLDVSFTGAAKMTRKLSEDGGHGSGAAPSAARTLPARRSLRDPSRRLCALASAGDSAGRLSGPASALTTF